ncbi:MAG: hypothetical protein Q7U08_04560 [Flavobacteriaceae bacterium]|nr:hypothetical protein [Flavobacteriaceae bacterium]
MKKLVLFMLILGFMIPNLTSAKNFNIDGYYDEYSPVELEENGILFFVFPDGEFEFEILRPRHIDLSFRFRNGHVSLGKNLPLRIEQDRYGNILRIDNVFIDYNRFGKVSRIGSVDIYYNRGMIHRMGYLNIVYHPMNRIQYIGYINDNHRHYSYKKSYGRQYSYNDHHMRNRNVYEDRNQYDRNRYEYSQRDYKEIKHKKEVSYRDNNKEITYKNKQVEPLKKRRPYSN